MNPETILVVEDEPDVLEVVSLLLEDAAYRVVQATSGEEALSTLQVTEPDLIISDVVMPGIDGFAFFEQVRADAGRSQIPFVFLTSLDQKTAVRQGMGLGADDYLTKPFEPEDLLSAVETRLARATQTRDYREQESREQLERSHQALADRVAELEALHDIGVAVSSTLDSEAILQLIVNLARELVNASSCSVLLPDQETGELVFRAATDPIVGMRVPPGQGVAARVLQQRTSLIVHDTAADPAHYGQIGQECGMPTRSLLAVPLLVEDRAIGVLSAVDNRPGRFTQQHCDLFLTLASQAATAMENARLYRDLEEQMRALQDTQAQLIHSEKTAAVGRLTASIAHEINNPLQSVQGCLTLAEEEMADGQNWTEIEHYLEIAGNEIERIVAIVGRMRDFYRPVREERQPTDVHAILDSVLALSRKELQHADVSVVREWASELPLIRANPDHLKQVFLNLVLNAKDAMPQGGTLLVRTASDQMPTNGGRSPLPAVRMEFTDTGIGMSQETQACLFEPFFTTKEQGMGLGLSISYGIVESHLGQISVKSQQGKGTTFAILLPATCAPPSELDQESYAAQMAGSMTPKVKAHA